jgi:hypothetical protein
LPAIHINGNNPGTVQVGVSYADLGATITGPKADLNLGITTLLDGTTTTSIQLDTTKPGVHTILGDEVCPKKSDGTSVCVTGDQLSALLSGSVLGASTHNQSEAAAGTPASGTEAPARLPAPPNGGGDSADTASTAISATSSPPVTEASSTPAISPPANDNNAPATTTEASTTPPVQPAANDTRRYPTCRQPAPTPQQVPLPRLNKAAGQARGLQYL